MTASMEARVLEAIDVKVMLAYLGELVAIPSLSGQETAAQEHIAAQMARSGLEVDLWELDFASLRQHPAFCVEVERESGLGVVGVMGGTNASGGRVSGCNARAAWNAKVQAIFVHNGRVYDVWARYQGSRWNRTNGPNVGAWPHPRPAGGQFKALSWHINFPRYDQMEGLSAGEVVHTQLHR